MGECLIPKLQLDSPNSDKESAIFGRYYFTWTNWLETLFTLCDSIDRLCHTIDINYPIYQNNPDRFNSEENVGIYRMNADVIKHRTKQHISTLDHDTLALTTTSTTSTNTTNGIGSDAQIAETDPTEANRYIRNANIVSSQNLNQSLKSNYPCGHHYNSSVPQHGMQISSDLPQRNNIPANFSGFNYSPISNPTSSNSEQYCYINDAYNLDYQYQLYLDAWAQSVQTFPQQQSNQHLNQQTYDCKDMNYGNYQYGSNESNERYNQSPSTGNKLSQLNYDGSTTPATSTPNYSPTYTNTYTTKRRKDDLSVPKATSEFDYLLSMPSQRIPVNSKDDMKCEIAGVYWDKRSWIASWYEDGKRYYKSFSARTHGFYRSKYFAIQIRLGKVRQNIIKQQRPRPRKLNHD